MTLRVKASLIGGRYTIEINIVSDAGRYDSMVHVEINSGFRLRYTKKSDFVSSLRSRHNSNHDSFTISRGSLVLATNAENNNIGPTEDVG